MDSKKCLIKLSILNVLSMLDALITYVYVCDLKIVGEVNPIMEAAIQNGPITFFIVKFIIIFLVSVGLYFSRKHKFAVYVVNGGLFVFSVVMIIHMYMFYLYLSIN